MRQKSNPISRITEEVASLQAPKHCEGIWTLSSKKAVLLTTLFLKDSPMA